MDPSSVVHTVADAPPEQSDALKFSGSQRIASVSDHDDLVPLDAPVQSKRPTLVDWDEIYRLQNETMEKRKETAAIERKLAALAHREAKTSLAKALRHPVTPYPSLDDEEAPPRKREREPIEYPYGEIPDRDQARKLEKSIKASLRRYECSRQQKRSALFSALELYPK